MTGKKRRPQVFVNQKTESRVRPAKSERFQTKCIPTLTWLQQLPRRLKKTAEWGYYQWIQINETICRSWTNASLATSLWWSKASRSIAIRWFWPHAQHTSKRHSRTILQRKSSESRHTMMYHMISFWCSWDTSTLTQSRSIASTFTNYSQ